MCGSGPVRSSSLLAAGIVAAANSQHQLSAAIPDGGIIVFSYGMGGAIGGPTRGPMRCSRSSAARGCAGACWPGRPAHPSERYNGFLEQPFQRVIDSRPYVRAVSDWNWRAAVRGSRFPVSALAAALASIVLASCPGPSQSPPPGFPQIAVRQDGDLLLPGSTIQCGNTTVGTPRDVPITIENTGDGELRLTGSPLVSLSGTDASRFSVPDLPAATVGAGAATSFTLLFSPDAARDFNANLVLVSNDADEGSLILAVQGRGTPEPAAEIDVRNPYGASLADGSGSYAFDSTLVGETTDATFMIWNLGDADLVLDGSPKVRVDGGDSSLFTVVEPGPDTPVPPSGQTGFTLCFAPTSTDTKSTTIIISSTDADENPFSFTVSGLCVAPEMDVRQGSDAIADGDGSYSFVGTTVGATTDIDFSILNTGTAALHLTADPRVAITGADASQFEVRIQPANPVAESGGRSDFRVRFAPSSSGAKTAEVVIENDDPDENPYTFTIGGEGLEAPPPTPSSFRVLLITSNSIQLAWDAASGAESYHLQSSSDGTSGWTDAPGGAALTDTSYTHTGLSTGATVYYRLAAVSAGGASGWSSVVSATTGTVAAPSPPSLVTPDNAVNPAALEWSAPLSWGAGVGPCTYTLRIDSVVRATNLSAAVTSFALSGLTSGVHDFQVIANNGSLTTPSETRHFLIAY